MGEADPTVANAKLEKGQSEAKLRQLTNKLEFLKAQLASEQSTISELKQVQRCNQDTLPPSLPPLKQSRRPPTFPNLWVTPDRPLHKPHIIYQYTPQCTLSLICAVIITHPLIFLPPIDHTSLQVNERDVQKIEDLRMEFRLKMQEYDKRKEEAVVEAERRVTAVYEDRMVELTTLQAKMASVKG